METFFITKFLKSVEILLRLFLILFKIFIVWNKKLFFLLAKIENLHAKKNRFAILKFFVITGHFFCSSFFWDNLPIFFLIAQFLRFFVGILHFFVWQMSNHRAFFFGGDLLSEQMDSYNFYLMYMMAQYG